MNTDDAPSPGHKQGGSDAAVLRRHLLNLLREEEAHVQFARVIRDWPPALRGKRPDGALHSAWELLEHMRIAQWDILEFVRNPDHVSPSISETFPDAPAPARAEDWDRSVATFLRERREVEALAADPQSRLFEPVPYGDGQSLLREILLVADHNAYHLGQLVQVRRLLDIWPPGEGGAS